MPPQFTKEEWLTEVDETDGFNFPETPILTVTVHDEDETNKFQYKVRPSHTNICVTYPPTHLIILYCTIPSQCFRFVIQVIENSGYGADKFTMVRNNDGTGSLKIVQPLDYEDQLQSNGFRFRIQVNDKVR